MLFQSHMCVWGLTTMNRTMMPGPIASAASVEGAKEPTASPREVAVKDSRVRIPQNLANLRTMCACSHSENMIQQGASQWLGN